MKMKKRNFKYSAEYQNYTDVTILGRANTLEEIEAIARKQMFKMHLTDNVTIFTDNGCTIVKRLAL